MNPPVPVGCRAWLALVASLVLSSAAPRVRSEPSRPAALTAEQQKQLRKRDRLWTQAQQLRSQGKLAEAVAAAEKMVAIERHLFGPSHPEVAGSLEYLAGLSEGREDFSAARKARRQVLDLQTKLWGAGHWRVTDARLALADTERLARLKPEQRRQLAEADRLGEEGVALHQKGNFRAALDATGKALAILKQVLGEQHPDYATGLNNLASLYQAQGNYAKAEPLYLKALAICKQVLGEKHPDYATSLNNLAGLYQAQGDYAQALPLFLQALAIWKQALGEQHPAYATSLNNLAALYYAQGDYAKAEPLFLKALAVDKKALGEKHPGYATDLNNLAELYRGRGEYARAEPLSLKALAIWKQALEEQHPAYAQSLNNLALLYYAKRDYAKAEPLFLKALAIDKKALGQNHPGYATDLNNLAALYEALGDDAQALPLYLKALAIRKQALGQQHPDYATSLNNLALLYSAKRDYARAESLLKQGLGIERRNLDRAADAQSERQQLAMTHDLRWTLDAYLSLAPHAQILGGDAYAPVLSWKGAVCARQRRSHRLRRLLHQNKDSALARLAADLQRTGGRLAALAFAVPDPKKRSAWQRQLEDLSERKEALEKALARHSAAFRAELRQQALTPAQLQASLPRDAALLDFLEYTRFSPPPRGKGPLHRERHLAVFVVRPGHPIRQFDLGPVQPIRAAIDQWRLTLERSRPRQGVKDPAVQLRQVVWQPLTKYLDGVKTVLVSPDGALTRLPFAALPGKDPDRYLIEEVALAVVPVPQLLPELLAPAPAQGKADQKPTPPSLLLVGDVNFGALPGPATGDQARRSAPRRSGKGLWSFEALDETRVEILAVRDSFEERFPEARVTVLRKARATEAAVRTEAPQHRYLHLATHGFFAPPELRSALAPDPQQGKRGTGFGLFDRHGVSGFHPGLLSGLVLAGANRLPQPDQDDGILTALEVADLDLGNVELAVLSACETGLGASAGGEGLLGLQRAFQVAGAKSVLASLWKVQDKASRALMVRFYKNLWEKKLSRLEALREAQRWMLREGVQRGLVVRELKPKEKARTPPLYWAAFQLSGDWR